MPFACAAVIGIALVYLTYLTIRQIMLGPRKTASSDLPVPPRAVTGHGALPVLGHSIQFVILGPDFALLFPTTWREWWCLPWSRKLGDVFSVFIWGNWRVVIKGPDRAKRLFERHQVNQGWSWQPPVTLLGKSCMSLLNEDEALYLEGMIGGPLCQKSILRHAGAFAEKARDCIDQVVAGDFIQGDRELELHERDPNTHKVTWQALRSYTFDLMDGPILNLDKYSRNNTTESNDKSTDRDNTERTVRFQDDSDQQTSNKKNSRFMMMLWMERLKLGLLGIKLTLGPEWTNIWRLNEYGRALNAKKHLDEVIGAHIEQRDKFVSVHHAIGHSIRDPFISSLPLLSLTENFFTISDPIQGDRFPTMDRDQARKRCQSEPEWLLRIDSDSNSDSDDDSDNSNNLASPLEKPVRQRAKSEADCRDQQATQKEPQKKLLNSPPIITKKKKLSVLDSILRQEDFNGQGITKASATEVSLLIWMMMDAGNAWTAMALNILSNDSATCERIQAEIDRLLKLYGSDRLFTPFVLGKMTLLDALIAESIRLCPDFLGGMKLLGETIEMDGVQIPKNTNIIFSEPTIQDFHLDNAEAIKPECMGESYPSVNLHGFLALNGFEVPLMVLQTKVFLIVLLKEYCPSMSKKRTFTRRMTTKLRLALHRQVTDSSNSDSDSDDNERDNNFNNNSNDSTKNSHEGRPEQPMDIECGHAVKPRNNNNNDASISRSASAKLKSREYLTRSFTKIPFPQPRRVITIRPRKPAGQES